MQFRLHSLLWRQDNNITPSISVYNALGQGAPMTTSSNPLPRSKASPDEPPPVFGRWRRFYAVVIANTVLVYLLLYLFSYYAGR
jgi:hypothetical protein